jgi:hypothetical protein
MKNLPRSILLFVFALGCLTLPVTAFCYGSEGHETVGALADELIQGTAAETHVRQLLTNDTLAHAATWADRLKSGPRDHEMQTYVTQNPQHHHYHYTDVPIEELLYKEATAGTSPDDIVHVLKQCIEVLRGNDSPAANPHGFSQRTALLLTAHLVGDMHQPLHVGAAYLNKKNRFVNPNIILTGVEQDQGGNFLKYNSGELHAYWDSNAVKRAMSQAGASTPEKYATIILHNSPVVPLTTGAIEDWPRKWSEEMLLVAATAHRGVKASKPSTVTDHFGTHLQWPVSTPNGYDNWARDTVHERLTTAGHRLAQLLEMIWP